MEYRREECVRDGQDGFALLVALIAIVGLTALATGGFLLANSERQVSANHQAVVEAFYLANAGLNDYLANQTGAPPTGPTSYGPYAYQSGTAAVQVMRVSTAEDPGKTTGAAGDPGLYLVTSEGRYDPHGTGNPVTRTVSSVTIIDPSTIPDFNAAITSGGGIRKQGSSGEINGNDECGQESTRAGVRVPVDGYNQSGGGTIVYGDPPVEEVTDPLDFDGDGSTTEEERWWDGMLDGSGVEHDHVVQSGDDFPDTSGSSGMPVTYVDQDNVSLGSGESGEGLLIVRGNVNFLGGFDWDGIILVGGSVTDNGIGEIEGAVMTGLNRLKGQSVNQDDLDNDTNDDDTLNGTKKFLFHSCFVKQVQQANAVLAELPGTWHEAI